jgi:IclR family pca regulon transcriptional regulator
MAESSPEYVRSLARGLAVIRAFDVERARQSLSGVARATGLTRASARRSLLTLVELGYVRTDGSMFWLSPQVLELGYSYLSSLSLPETAQPHLEVLAGQVKESTSVSILDGCDIVYVARVAVKRIMSVNITIGTRFPAYATSMGRILLAGLSEGGLEEYLGHTKVRPLTQQAISTIGPLREAIELARRDGYAIVDQELEEGLRSLAAPIRGPDGSVIAAANISTQVSRYTEADVRNDLLPALLQTAASISDDCKRSLHVSVGG